jgi:hypothetical protein
MPHHVVVDGSNIATEGRQMPSLAQLNEAVMAFMVEHPDALITVVVDATFGHRIDGKESKEFDEAVANNELVAPPAGAVGRGDAFVLSIANKVNATILSNDSFQEFHPQYDWLFDEGRLIGGKPVPHIGWVFVPRVPVRGQVSRSAMKDAKRKRGGTASAGSTVRTGSPEASLPMPVPKAPPPGVRRRGAAAAAEVAVAAVAAAERSQRAERSPRNERAEAPKGTAVNDLLTFLSFVEHHPVGSSVNAVVESYSSHGAYVRVGEAKAYVPLRLMSDPPPRSAREFMKIGDAVTLVVESFAPARRSIDLATATVATAKAVEAPTPKKARVSKKAATGAAAKPGTTTTATDATTGTSRDTAAGPAPKRRTRKAVATAPEAVAAEATPAKKAATAPKKAAAAPKKAAAAPKKAAAAPKKAAAAPKKAAAAPKKAGAAKKAAPAVQPAVAAVPEAPAAAPKKATRARAKAAPASAPELPLEAPTPAPAKRSRATKAAPAAEPAAAPAATGRRRRSS